MLNQEVIATPCWRLGRHTELCNSQVTFRHTREGWACQPTTYVNSRGRRRQTFFVLSSNPPSSLRLIFIYSFFSIFSLTTRCEISASHRETGQPVDSSESSLAPRHTSLATPFVDLTYSALEDMYYISTMSSKKLTNERLYVFIIHDDYVTQYLIKRYSHYRVLKKTDVET